jgi:alpha-D-xyloside xylohydrolase
MTPLKTGIFVLCAGVALCRSADAQLADHPPTLLSDLVDVSADFREYRNTYFLADKLASFDPATGHGTIVWTRNQLYPRIAFPNMENVLRPFAGMTFPDGEYAVNPVLPFSIQFVSPRTVRIRIKTSV